MGAPLAYVVLTYITLGGATLILYWFITYLMGEGLQKRIDRFLADYRAGRIKVKDPLLLMALEDED